MKGEILNLLFLNWVIENEEKVKGLNIKKRFELFKKENKLLTKIYK